MPRYAGHLPLLITASVTLRTTAGICEVSIYTDATNGVYCDDPAYLVRKVSLADNSCVYTTNDNSFDTGLIFSTISTNCQAGVFLGPTGSNTSAIFSGNCESPDLYSHSWSISTAFTETCIVPVPGPIPNGSIPANIYGLLCLCNSTATWTTSTTLHYTSFDYNSAAANTAAQTASRAPVFAIGSAEISSLTALSTVASASINPSTHSPIVPGTASNSGTVTPTGTSGGSGRDPDSLQKKSNQIALGVGLGLGLPTLILSIPGLCLKCRRGPI